jgi:transcriptional regulator with XRE-family HTH domain
MGMSQGDLAQRANALGVPLYQQTIAKLESGHRSLKFSEAEAIARALETTVAELSSSEDMKKKEVYRKPPPSTEDLKATIKALEQTVAQAIAQVHAATQDERAAKQAADEAQYRTAAASMARRQSEEREIAAQRELRLAQTRLQQLEASQASIGHAVRNRRYDLHLSIDELSRATRVRPEIIEAIEAEDFNWRPAGSPKSDVYARGSIRVLAEYLGLDGDALVDLYDQEYSSDASER